MDPALSDVSDKVGVILSELGEQEDVYARSLDEARGTLKTVRDTERSVAPVRAGRERVAEEIARVKAKEPGSARLVVLEQELVRAEAEGLVGEAQVGNVVSFFLFLFSDLFLGVVVLTGTTDTTEAQGGVHGRVFGDD